jgi:hypothetical protein
VVEKGLPKFTDVALRKSDLICLSLNEKKIKFKNAKIFQIFQGLSAF